MNIYLSPQHAALIDEWIREGLFPDRQSALSTAVELLRTKQDLIAEIKVGIDEIARGEYIEYDDESMRERIEQIKAEGRERLRNRKEAS